MIPYGDGSERAEPPEWRVIRTRIRWNRFARLLFERQPEASYDFDIFDDDTEAIVSSTINSDGSAVMVTEASVIVINDDIPVAAVYTAQDIMHGMSDQFADALLNGTALDPFGMLSESESDNPFDDDESEESEDTTVPDITVDGAVEDLVDVPSEAEVFWDTSSIGTDRPDMSHTY